MLTNMKALLKSCIVNLAVLAIWYVTEFLQYRTLQFDRRCDNIVSLIYVIIIWYAFNKEDRWIQAIKDIVTHENKNPET